MSYAYAGNKADYKTSCNFSFFTEVGFHVQVCEMYEQSLKAAPACTEWAWSETLPASTETEGVPEHCSASD